MQLFKRGGEGEGGRTGARGTLLLCNIFVGGTLLLCNIFVGGTLLLCNIFVGRLCCCVIYLWGDFVAV